MGINMLKYLELSWSLFLICATLNSVRVYLYGPSSGESPCSWEIMTVCTYHKIHNTERLL